MKLFVFFALIHRLLKVNQLHVDFYLVWWMKKLKNLVVSWLSK